MIIRRYRKQLNRSSKRVQLRHLLVMAVKCIGSKRFWVTATLRVVKHNKPTSSSPYRSSHSDTNAVHVWVLQTELIYGVNLMLSIQKHFNLEYSAHSFLVCPPAALSENFASAKFSLFHLERSLFLIFLYLGHILPNMPHKVKQSPIHIDVTHSRKSQFLWLKINSVRSDVSK